MVLRERRYGHVGGGFQSHPSSALRCSLLLEQERDVQQQIASALTCVSTRMGLLGRVTRELGLRRLALKAQ